MILPAFVAALYCIQSPVHAGIPGKTNCLPADPLSGFEGYYQFDRDTSQYIQILVKSNKLVLKQLWDEQEITFDQKSDLYFYNEQKKFPLTFTKGANGEITQVLAFEHDTWIRVKGYQPVLKKEIKLPADKMQAYAGTYKITNEGNEAFLEFTVHGNSLEVKEVWSGKIFTIVPESELVFFGKKAYYPVQFTKDKDGNITQALIFNHDVWVKVKG